MASTLPQLLRAIQAGQTQEVKRILSYNASLAHARQARDGHTPLHVASATGNLAIVRELLQGGARCQETDSNLEVPLHIAARQRNGAAVVKELIADAGRRSCLKSMNRDGATPLHLAVQAGLLDIVQLLVNAGSKVDATDRSGRTPLDYVDPRLPGLAEVLETGRQLTPVRATSRSSSKTKASPYHSPAAPIAAYRGPAAPPSPSGHNMSTSQRRSSSGGHVGSGYSSWETSPTPHQQHRALSPQGQQLNPVERRHGDGKQSQRTPQGRHSAGGLSREVSAAREPGGPAAEGSSASLASPKPPRQHSSHTAGAAVIATALQQQQLASPVRNDSRLIPSGALQDSSSMAHCPSAADEPPARTELHQQGHEGLQERLLAVNQAAGKYTPEQSLPDFAAEAAGTPAAALDHEQQHDTPAADASEGTFTEQQQGPASDATQEAASGADTPPADTIEAATAQFVQQQQQQQQQVAALAAGTWGSAGGAAVATDSTAAASSGHALQKQQQQQPVSSNAAAPPGQQEMLQGPLQQQAPTALPPATVHPAGGGLVAGPASAAAGAPAPAASAGGAGVYCRGPLSLAQPQMQPMAAAGLAGSNGPGSIGAHYQQLAAATMACQQSLQQLQGNVSQLAVFRSSSNVASGSLGGVPMGPLRSGRVAAAAAAAGDSSRGPADPFAGSTGGSAVFKGGLGQGGADMYGAQRRHSSSNNGMAGANSWIVTPEASSGLLGASLVAGSSAASHVGQGQPGPASSSGGHATVGAAASAAGADAGLSAAGLSGPADEAAGDSKQQHQLLAEHTHGATQVSKADTAAPPAAGASATATNAPNSWAGDRSHPVLAAAQQLHRQQQQLAGIAAAVAASGAGSGPLQALLLAQLGELSGKVARLEDWFEAQVELIPDWQKALEVVQAVKRQADDHSHLLTEQDGKLANQASFIMDLAGKVDGFNSWSQTAQEGSSKQDQNLAQLKADQAGLRCYLAEFELRMQQLQDQVALQAAAEGDRAAAGEAQVSSLVSQLDDTNSRLDATAARLSTLESTAVEAKQQLLEQQQAVAAATALAAAAAERSAAAEVAAATAAAGGNDGSGSSRSRSSIVALRPCGSNAQQALLTESLTKQLADLKLQFAELSAAVSNMSRASRVAAAFSRKHSNESQSQDLNQGPPEAAGGAAGALILMPHQGAEAAEDSGLGGDQELPPEFEESWLPFMESTSACLASHEQQLEALQSLVPKLEGVVSQRAQLINLAEQLAALQTAFNMLSHGHSRSTSQGGGAAASPLHALVPAGPLGAHKAAADTLSLATSLVKLQGQMGQLTLAVEGLRDEWEEEADAVRGEREAIRRDWEAERARIAAAESEVARLLSEQQAEFAEREERLIQIRAAASDADEAARVAALEAQQRFASQLAGLQAQQALMAQQLAAAHASNDALRAELTAVQGKLAATADAEAAMAEAQAAATAAAATATAAKLQQPAVEHAGVQHEAAATATAAVQAGGDTTHSIWQAQAADPSYNSIITADCSYPHVRQLASPADNPFLVDSLAPAAAPAALAAAAVAAEEGAAAAAEASAASLALSGEPSAELAVLGQQRLVSSSVFGAAYWGATDARRSSSDNCSLQSPSSAVIPPAAAAAELGEQRRRMTYDAAVPVGSDRDSRALQSSSTTGSFFAGQEPAARGAAPGAVRQGVRVTDTYPASAAAAAAMLVPAGAAGGNKKKGWLSKVRLGHSSGGSKAAAGLQQHQLEVVDVAQTAKRSAGGVLFGRWSKQAKASAAAGPQVAATGRPSSTDNWPSMVAASGAATDSRAAGQQGGLPGSTAGRDTKGGSDSDQLAACGAATRTLGYRAAVQPPPPAATAGSEHQSGSKWKRRLLGKSSKV